MPDATFENTHRTGRSQWYASDKFALPSINEMKQDSSIMSYPNQAQTNYIVNLILEVVIFFIYQVIWLHLYDTTSSGDKGTLYAALKFLMTFNQVAIETAIKLPCMMHMNVEAIKLKPEMILFNNYKFHFSHVCRAFIKKYQNENTSFTRTTIAHVSMIDHNKF